MTDSINTPGGAPADAVYVVDVGHGNAALVVEPGQVTLVDAGSNGFILDVLDHLGIRHVHTVLVSHADEDHVGGVEPLLGRADVRVDHILLNSAESRGTAAWMALRRALAAARARRPHKTIVQVGLTADTPLPVRHTALAVEVLAPQPERGPDAEGRRQTSHDGCAVVRVTARGEPVVLLAGDVSSRGLEYLLAATPAPRARVLVYPHHGGLAGGPPGAFVRRLVAAVEPEVVVFSNGRSRAGFPRPDVVRAVLDARPGVHVACTQLAVACAPVVPPVSGEHLGDVPSRGREGHACCAGTLCLAAGGVGTATIVGMATPSGGEHAAFVDRCAPTAMCRPAERP